LERRLISQGDKVVVGVSGGPDSVCLLHILNDLRDKLGFFLHITHLDHQLRGKDSEADARYVAGLAKKLCLPVTIESRDVKTYRDKQKVSLEEAAREVRYDFFAEVAKAVGAPKVAVGHTQNDHIETILMHLIRGSGTRGLRGLQPLSQLQGGNLTIIRPLMEVSREETEEYCQQNGLSPRTDSTNLLLSQLRNRIRHELLPLLQKYNPRIADALVRTARIAADDIAFLESEVAKAWKRVASVERGAIALDKKSFLKLPVAMHRHLLRMALQKLVGNIKDIEAQHIERIIAALEKPAGKTIVLPEGIIFSLEYDRYLLAAGLSVPSPLPPLGDEFALNVPGETKLDGWMVRAEVVRKSMPEQPAGNYVACFDAGKVGKKLAVRARRQGDRFQPLGMGESKNLGDFMVDAKIPRAWRDSIPLVCSSGDIIWVVGWRIDERFKVTEKTKQVLRLEFERLK
jgi:tRNA(Ile)-lysidine synthase